MADIDIDDFANQSLMVALRFGINAHYVAAVAMRRSKLKDDTANGQVGPSTGPRPNGTATRTEPTPAAGRARGRPLIADWRAQTTVFAWWRSATCATLQATLGKSPSAIQIYQKQWPTAADPPLSGDLQKAPAMRRRYVIVSAINDELADPATAAARSRPRTSR